MVKKNTKENRRDAASKEYGPCLNTRGFKVQAPDNRRSRSFRTTWSPPRMGLVTPPLFNCLQKLAWQLINRSNPSTFSSRHRVSLTEIIVRKPPNRTSMIVAAEAVQKLLTSVAFWHFRYHSRPTVINHQPLTCFIAVFLICKSINIHYPLWIPLGEFWGLSFKSAYCANLDMVDTFVDWNVWRSLLLAWC